MAFLERAGSVWSRAPLEGVLAGLASADAHDLLERRDEDLPVTDLPGASRVLDGFDNSESDRMSLTPFALTSDNPIR